ncbi:MAG: DivIVA domain-containing protein [Provencibacterium sp.]|jgi:cell division initiation protein|nr:DivIVA domain-containing protein [Provencibacterium sp.]
MLSYNDIISYKFEKAGFGGGYRSEDVDKFTMRIAADYQKLEQEKVELEQKLMALAEKVEEYREDEESLRAALLGAQKLGDSIIRESKQKSEAMLASARAEADRLVDGARRQIEREQGMLTKVQKEASNFKNRLLILYKQHLELISSIPGQDVTVDAQEIIHAVQNPPAPQPPAEPREEPVSEPPAAEQAPPIPPEAPAPEPDYQAPAAPQPAQPARESRFGELQFGEGYDLSHR